MHTATTTHTHIHTNREAGGEAYIHTYIIAQTHTGNLADTYTYTYITRLRRHAANLELVVDKFCMAHP